MCAVSVVSEWGQQQFKTDPSYWQDPRTWNQYKNILNKLAELDAKLGLPNCEDPSKAAWMKEVEARLKKLENGNS